MRYEKVFVYLRIFGALSAAFLLVVDAVLAAAYITDTGEINMAALPILCAIEIFLALIYIFIYRYYCRVADRVVISDGKAFFYGRKPLLCENIANCVRIVGGTYKYTFYFSDGKKQVYMYKLFPFSKRQNAVDMTSFYNAKIV